MRVNSQGTVVIPKKGKKLETLYDIMEIIMISAMDKAIMQVVETKNCIMVEFEHGQVKTPKDVSTKIKIGDKTLLKVYKMFEDA